MKRSVITSLLTLITALSVTTAARAQIEIEEGPKPSFREGFWYNIAGGWGSQGCSACSTRVNGGHATITLGGSLDERILIGAAFTGWMGKQGDTSLVVVSADARFRWYPTGGLFLAFGAGLSAIGDNVFGPGVPSEFGTSLVLGIGYDLRVAQKLSITPYVNYSAGKTENLDANVTQVGLSITGH
jgi:hypothetical protein